MDKPLKDWTLGEASDYCRKGMDRADCDKCHFGSPTGKCTLCEHIPAFWRLAAPPRFTEQEVEDAKAILRMFEGYTYIDRNGCDLLLHVSEHHPFATALVPSMFPSIKDGETVNLKEIAGESE
jgi:hypothetical protein